VAPTYASNGSFPLHQAIADLARKTADPSSAAALETMVATRKYRGAAHSYEAALEAVRRAAVSKADAALVDEARRRAAPPAVLEELWDAFLADPSDEARRLVLADALQSAGDPRGEFIAIQVAIAEGHADAAARRRAAALLDANVDAWSGAVPGVERASRRFARGFLVAAAINDIQGVPAALGARSWRTLEELSVDRWASRAPELPALLAHLPLLRVFSTPREDLLPFIAQGPPLPSLRAVGDVGDSLLPPGSPGLPALAVLVVNAPRAWEPAAFGALLDRVAPLGLRALVYKSPHMREIGHPIRAWRNGRHLPELRFALSHEPGFRTDRWRARARLDSPRVDVAWAGGSEFVRSDLPSILASLAEDDACREVAVDLGRGRAKATLDDATRTAIAKLEARGASVRLDGDPIDLAEVPPDG
jgi:uncharacterized protein (TIGR02996 family)